MGSQASSISQRILPADAVDSLQFEIKKQVHIFSEINNLGYEDFQKCLADLNRLSRKCLDPNGKQLVFAVKKGTDNSILWKRTVRIACVKIDPETRKIDCFKLLTLQQFLQVFRTFQTNLHAMVTVESQRIHSPGASPSRSSTGSSATGPPDTPPSAKVDGAGPSAAAAGAARPPPESPARTATPTTVPLSSSASTCSSSGGGTFVFPDCTTASILMAQVDAIAAGPADATDHADECCICLERRPEVSLPCAHSYCMPCIEQWNIHQKTCPICDEALASTDDTWVLSEMPEANEVSEEICATLLKLSNEPVADDDDDGDRNWLRRMLDL
ncbi:RING finger protein 141-like [Anopheles arabiensis]|uniref:RING finger protein 141 n=3 Tax=gambiae species complex TaxID=44542 RepID=Q5TUN7_ANOGA|nr:RING finger protein 141-like [Anopheles arabiensis]XP_040221873.1 RING finger protein 141-like [Anopheles coluzzii]XP_559376.4 RING finger protein 141 [Anopheles gambiae]EAL41124.4 AGAP000736-PA [Anopheles gambiae str. PEST]